MASTITVNGGVALITGAASGIGRGIAFAFAEAGATAIVFADINEQEAQKAAEESKSHAKHPDFRSFSLKVDITNEASVQNMVDTTVREFTRIDYSINSAGLGNLSGAVTPHLKLDIASKTFDTNIYGTMLCLRAVTKVMTEQDPLTHTSPVSGERSLGRGSIVNIASGASYVAAPGMLPYVTSKHAMIGLTKSAAVDCLKQNIRVNAVCPAWVDTPMTQASIDRNPQWGQLIKKASPLGRAATVEEIADYVIFLCSPSATYINGTGLMMDAGFALTANLA